MDLIAFIVIIAFISKIIKKAKKPVSEKLREVEQALKIEDKPVGTYQMPKQNVRTTPAYEQITLQQAAQQQRVQQNRSAMQQVRAGKMETEHNHSERIAPAEHYHPEDVISENMLGTIEDLMVKGYEGNLCFERDFVGEAMDMISRFTVPSDVPDFSKDDVA